MTHGSWWPVLALGVILLLFIGQQCLLPLRSAVKIGADEDFELSKATLLMRGYHLNSQVWDDQPPLDTFLITKILQHLTPSILGPRLLTVGFTVVLLSAVFYIGLRLHGLLAAVVWTVLLMASPGFLELSASSMQEIPSLAPAVGAICLLLVGRRAPCGGRGTPCEGTRPTEGAPRGGARPTDRGASDEGERGQQGDGRVRAHGLQFGLAGAVFGVALQLKLIGVVYLPLAVLAIAIKAFLDRSGSDIGFAVESVGDSGSRKQSARTASMRRAEAESSATARVGGLRGFPYLRAISGIGLFGIGAALSFVLLNALTGNPLLLQLKQGWAAHFATAKSFEYGSPADHPYDWSVFLKNWDTSFLALVGIGVLLLKVSRAPMALLPLAWLGMTYIVFPSHLPWWSYYYIHNAVPLCWCAALGLVFLWGFARARRSKAGMALVASYALAAAAWMSGRLYLQATSIRSAPKLHAALVLKEMARYKPFTEFLFADEPIYSFHSGIPMPPHLAMISLKRLWTGDMTSAKLAEEMSAIKPGLVLLRNDTRELPFQDLIDHEYRMTYQDFTHRLFVHKSIVNKPPL